MHSLKIAYTNYYLAAVYVGSDLKSRPICRANRKKFFNSVRDRDCCTGSSKTYFVLDSVINKIQRIKDESPAKANRLF